ncbi:chitobiase/beta-hexosaminidase C-terminal domain-containing protein [uncultured Treponema sp.]|uniref:chitobiase/beta-hexosaminidase C-terminal domain-containing protein n=1 Tax=uncultured Treponema sp. TaxID=162155 RepID=UPI0025D12B8A|nr:chitobiase/beta-hexosaminidase C-terminal domain-containing protein [uncultured Treponema sp.]
MASETEGAKIYYTTDGTEPTTSSTEYAGTAVSIDASKELTTIKAIAVKEQLEISPVSYAIISIKEKTITSTTTEPAQTETVYKDKEYASAVTFGTSVNEDGSVSVTMATETAGAEIFYTDDGAAPTNQSKKYAGAAVKIEETTTIKAIAIPADSNVENSPVSVARISISKNEIAKKYAEAVTFSIGGTDDAKTLVLSTATEGAKIYYTIGSDTTSTLYESPIAIPAPEATTDENVKAATLTVKAFASAEGIEPSPVSIAVVSKETVTVIKTETKTETVYQNKNYAAAVTFAPVVNDDKSVSVKMACATEGATIYYTDDGTEPSNHSKKYVQAIKIPTTNELTTIKAIAISADEKVENSPVSVANIVINSTNASYLYKTYAAAVTFKINSENKLELSSATEGAKIYYTSDLSTPTASSTLYSEALDVPTTTGITTYKAIAVKEGIENSPVSVAILSVTEKEVEVTPTETPDTTAPANVTELKAEAKDGAVVLEWTNATDEDIFGYEVSYSGETPINKLIRAFTKLDKKCMIVAADAGGCIVSGLTNGTEYTFTVKSVDLSGNKSAGVAVKGTPVASTVTPTTAEPMEIVLSAPETPTNKTVVVTAAITSQFPVEKVVYKKGSFTDKDPKVLLADTSAVAAVKDTTDSTKWTFSLVVNETDPLPENGKYTVAALDSVGRRESAEIEINCFDFEPLDEVSEIDAQYNKETGKVILTWKDPSSENQGSSLDHIVIYYVPKDSEDATELIVQAGKQTAELDVDTSTGMFDFSIWTVDALGNESDGTEKANFKVKYTVTFDPCGGDVEPAYALVKSGTNYPYNASTLPVPKKTGCDFAGWFTSADGGDLVNADTDKKLNITADTTLYAHWTPLPTHTVTFVTGDAGISVDAQTVYDGEKATKPDCTKDGKAAKWYTDEGYTDEFDFDSEITDDITLYATFTTTYTVKFYNGTTVVASQTVFEGEKVTVPADIDIEVPEKNAVIWCKASATGTEFDFDTSITEDLELFAAFVLDTTEKVRATFDFTSPNTTWKIPTSKTVAEGTYTNADETYTIKLAGSSGEGFYSNTSYLMLGKQGAYLKLPAFTWRTTKIVVTGNSKASGNVKQNFYVGETAVSTETTGATSSNTYEIADSSQGAGTEYILKVTSTHNTQITKIEVYGYYEE